MKCIKTYTILLPAVATILSCNSAPKDTHKEVVIPGTVIDSLSEPVKEDTLNHFTCSVKIIADSAAANGVYIAAAMYGPNEAKGKFTMPKGMETARPILKKGTARYSYIVGFRIDDDTTFYDYFEITNTKSATAMRYINSYSFEEKSR